MIDFLLLAIGTAFLIRGLYPFVMEWLTRWCHNQIVNRAMANLDSELEWMQNNG